MDKEEENKYVSQLQEVFSSCDTTGTGYLDKDELTDLCHKLHLNAQLPLLLQTLLGNDHFARVNFEEFKEGFVAVLSSSIDISISEDDDDESSYLEPVIPDEVKPKFVKGTKKYGRRTQPEREAAENEANKNLQEPHQGKNKKKSSLRRSSSLESVESLKSDEEAEIVKEPEIENFEAEGQLRAWNTGIYDSPRRASDMTENQVRDIWEELGIGHNGYLNRQELATVCKNIGLEDLSKEELEDLFNKLDRDADGRVSFQEFQLGLFSHTPIASTPLKHRRSWALYQAEDISLKTPSLLSGFGGLHVFSSIDDGAGFGNPEQIMFIWEEEGVEDGKEILLSLDFSLEQRVNLMELTTALDNELIATKSRIHLAALASYKHELTHQHIQAEQISKERDKAKQDLVRAERRNSLLVDEVDDHNSAMESLNESKIKDLEQEYRQRLSSMRSELENEKEQFLHQTDQQKKKLETDLANYQVEQAYLRHKLDLSVKENSRLQKELVEVVGKLSESESQVVKLQTSLDQILQDKKLTDPHNTEFYTQEEKFAEIIREYEVQCMELRDRNDELQIQLETLQSQHSESKYTRLLAKIKDNKLLHHKTKEKIHHSHSNADTPAKKGLTSRLRRSVSAAGFNGLSPVMSGAPSMTMEAELTKHQVKELQQEIEDLKIQLETKVNYYEREVELMKVNFEKERKDTEQSFKLEISELEEQKADLEELHAKYQEAIDGLKEQLPKTAQLQQMEKRFEKERTAMEEYYAKEVSALGQRLSREKEQLEEDLKRSHQHEVQSMRMELTRLSEDNTFLRTKADRLQQDLSKMDDTNKQYRTQLEDLRKERECLQDKLEQLNKKYQDYQIEFSQSNVQHEETVLHLNTKLQEVTEQQDKANVVLEQLQGMITALETEKHEQQMVWKRERDDLEQELQKIKQENEKYWDELCQMNTQSLQLTSTLSDLTAQREESYGTVQQMNGRLRESIEEKHQASALVEQLQGKLIELKRENLQTEAVWQRDKEQLESDLQMCKQENLQTHNELCQLTSAVSQLKIQNKDGQENIQHFESRLKEVSKQKEEATATTERVQSQLHLLEREKTDWCQAREQLEQDLQLSKAKIEALFLQHKQEKQDLLNGLDKSNKQLLVVAALQEEVSSLKHIKQSLEEECQSVTRLLKEATDKVSQTEGLKVELKEAQEECQTLRRTQDQLRAEMEASQDQLLEANSKLTLAQSQQMREVQQWKEKVSSSVPKEQLSHLQSRLLEEQQKVQQLQERLRFHAEQTNRQLAMQQEEHERLLRRMEERMQEVEINLKNVRIMLREKVDQLKEQLEKNAKSDFLLKDLYVENAHLMKALQVTEQRQKSAEKKNHVLEDKIAALNKVVRKIAPASLAV
ncbi:PREDICTED: ninein-like protein [Nanorana parkeri]|uniref:ninein-like protein n=1 Tax=Nanorana parkeri TaxID=125878 RepID=UPI000853F739|nr:PREDICTED: ninein-like protein [Nanorana parkeri]